MPDNPRHSSRLWLISGVLLCLATLLTLVVLVFPAVRTPQQVAADASPPPALPITAKVEKRPLSGSIILRAVVVPGATVDLKPSDALVAANPVVTGLPAAGADTVQTGSVLIEANGEPLIAMNWPFPAYRDIHSGDTGPDVVELQKTLRTLGYSSSDTGVFDALTSRGVSQLYTDRGYTTPRGPAALTGDEAVQGSDGANANSRTQASGQAASHQVYLPASNVQSIPNPSSRITSIPVQIGQKLSTPDLVLAKLDGKASTLLAATTPERASRIMPGNVGALTVSDRNQQYAVKVTAVATSMEDVPSLGKGMRVDLDFADPAKAPPVSPNETTSKLEITTDEDSEPALVLPVTAIYSTQDGASYVIPASDPQSRIAVQVGKNVDGSVEVTGNPGLKEGDQVILGRQGTG